MCKYPGSSLSAFRLHSDAHETQTVASLAPVEMQQSERCIYCKMVLSCTVSWPNWQMCGFRQVTCQSEIFILISARPRSLRSITDFSSVVSELRIILYRLPTRQIYDMYLCSLHQAFHLCDSLMPRKTQCTKCKVSPMCDDV